MSSAIQITDQMPTPVLSIRERVQNTEIKAKMGEMFGQLWMFMDKHGIQVAGPPFAVYHDYDQQTCEMECGFPTVKHEKGEGKISPSSVPGGKCVMATHIGSYEKIMDTYQLIQEYIRREGLQARKVMWERYLNDPEIVKDENELVTEIYWPID